MENILTQSTLKKHLHYNPLTGVFKWKNIKHSRIKKGDIAGSLDGRGYRQIKLLGKVRKAHRLAWLYMTGEMPENQIDHINQIRTDNRFSNLRKATNKENNKNSTMQKNNTSGHTGVNKQKNRWIAFIFVDGKKLHLGSFIEYDDAVKCRKEAEKKYGFHKNHGRKLNTIKD